MKGAYLLFISFFFSVSLSNRHKELAAEKIRKSETGEAITHLRKIAELNETPEAEVFLNLGHLYFREKITDSAVYFYSMVSDKAKPGLISAAENQLGIIDFLSGKRGAAEDHFKNALYLNPSNDEAAYNYELLKRTEKGQEKNKPGHGKTPSGSKSSGNKASGGNNGLSEEAGTEPGELLRSATHEFSKEEMEKILDVYKKKNIRYLQQEEWKRINLQD